MKESLVIIENLEIGFKNRPVFKNINAEIRPGTLTALMGINGVGKSCFIKTLGHLQEPMSGSLKLEGLSYSAYSPVSFARKVALVLTERFQGDYLRVGELIALGRSPYTNWWGELKREDESVMKKVMDQLNIADLKNSFFTELSDGQKQKVLIARALCQRPQLLILDEPTTFLDIPSKIELLKLLKKIAVENNTAVVLSTHDLELIKDEVERIWIMGQDGKFLEGTPEDFFSSGIFKKYFYYN